MSCYPPPDAPLRCKHCGTPARTSYDLDAAARDRVCERCELELAIDAVTEVRAVVQPERPRGTT